MNVSRSGYYGWVKHIPSKREENNKILEVRIKEIFAEHEERAGSTKIHEYLLAKGLNVSKNRVAKIMRKLELRSKTIKKYRVITTDSNHNFPIAANLLNRQFKVDEPNKVLVSDITYVKTSVSWVYLTVFIDLFSRIVVGWSVSDTLSADAVLTALNRAIKNRKLSAGVIIHSDRGSQYASHAFRELIESNGFKQSMSGKGNCWDNAVAESFFKIYKSEMANHCKFTDQSDVLHETFDYIECYYNRKRRHGTLGYLTPVEFEKHFNKRVV